MLEQQRLGGDGADATGAEELREGDQQVDGKDQDVTHPANRTITAGTCKTARRVRIASHWEFATHRPGKFICPLGTWRCLAAKRDWR